MSPEIANLVRLLAEIAVRDYLAAVEVAGNDSAQVLDRLDDGARLQNPPRDFDTAEGDGR